ncbi:alpha/beta hydrolase [Halobacteriovorax sp. GB3]|uniref:alpha/beta fold hydrolase n=1 Tax=Halobacteriovorax sp. GB3 TaxID=2719615 RepID=UPI00236011EB|nr:alpha/beta hydrolase [Halobacteriovorax sp. GB3]MDD0851851.1 alpha/beta hydrolase [Halobacteriovorax sp. GB3]
MKNLLFIHGGPGLNSHADERMIESKFRSNDLRITFWNEPSEIRDEVKEVSFDIAIESLVKEFQQFQNPPVLIAHSFGAQYALALIKKLGLKNQKVIYICPDLEPLNTDLNIIKLAKDHFEREDKDKYDQLQQLTQSFTRSFDEIRIQALGIVGTYQELFLNYWVNKDVMAAYYSFLTDEYSFNINSYLAIRASAPLELIENFDEKNSLVLYSIHDPIINLNRNLDFKLIKESGHYPHIEAPDQIIEITKIFLS